MNKLKKFGIVLITLIVIAVLYFYIYPMASTHIPRSLKAKSKTYAIQSVYYIMNMDQLTKLEIDSTQIFLTGYNISFLKPQPEFRIIRDIPEKYLPLNNQDTTWKIMDSSKLDDDWEVRTFVNSKNNDRLVVWLPLMSGEPIWYVYNLINNKKLFVVSGGNWKRDKKVYLAYILLENKN